MSAPFDSYAPHDPSVVEIIQNARRAVDEMTRSNPLQNATVNSGLITWLGRYPDFDTGDPIAYVWIGELYPADPVLGGPQRTFVVTRDDTRGGAFAILMYDPFPNIGGSGLKQVLIFRSGDGVRLMEESRDGGQRWPDMPIPMGAVGSATAAWPGSNSDTPTYQTVWEGRAPIIGNEIAYRVFCSNDTGVASEHRLRVELPGGDAFSTTHVLGTGLQNVFDATMNVAAGRGGTYRIRWESRRTAGVNPNLARSTVLGMRCFTP